MKLKDILCTGTECLALLNHRTSKITCAYFNQPTGE